MDVPIMPEYRAKKTEIADTIKTMMAIFLCGLFLIGPLIFWKTLYDYGNLPQSVFIQSIALLLVLLWWIQAGTLKHILFSLNSFDALVILLLIYSIISLLWAWDRFEGSKQILHFAACVIIFFIISTSAISKKWLERMLICILAATTAVALIGLLQHFVNFSWIPQREAPAATFGNRNMAAEYVCITLPLFLIPSVRKNNFHNQVYFSFVFRVLRICSLIISVVFIVVSHCRTVWISFTVAMMYMAAMSYFFHNEYPLVLKPRPQKINQFVKPKLVFFSVFLFLYTIFLSWNIIENNSFLNKLIKNATNTDSLKIRMALWDNSFEMIKDRPLFGYGIGNFKVFYPEYNQKATQDPIFGEEKQPRNIHNDYIQIFVELGVFGILIFIALIVGSLTMVGIIINHKPSDEIKWILLPISAGIISFIIISIFSFPLERAQPPLYLMVFMGVVNSIFKEKHKIRKCKIHLNSYKFLFIIVVLFMGIVKLFEFNYNRLLSDYYYSLSYNYEKEGNWQSAVEMGIKSFKYNRFNVSALELVGKAYIESFEYEKGVQALEQVLKTSPYNINVLLNISVGYAKLDEREKAVDCLYEILKIKPNYQKALMNLGMLYEEKKDFDSALKYYEQAAIGGNENEFLHIRIGRTKMKKRQYNEAAMHFEKALELNPNNSHLLIMLIALYQKHLKEYNKAINHIYSFCLKNPDSPTSKQFIDALFRFSKQLKSSGNIQQAKEIEKKLSKIMSINNNMN